MNGQISAEIVLAKMEEGFAGMNRRIDDLAEQQREMNGSVGRANERLAGAEERIRSMGTRLDELIQRVELSRLH